MNLVIVESPTKAKTISKFLDKSYQVESSFGHIRDLPKSEMGIDIKGDFEPKYIVPTKAKKTVTKLKKLAEKADNVILASDEDREGEAIAWHLMEALKLKKNQIERIVFHEITKEAILEALANPRNLDYKLVDAQQARRVLDRLVGYELSPFLWKKVTKGLSAGRVQSVAVRLVVEREREIQGFKPQEYWKLIANLKTTNQASFNAELYKINNKIIDKYFVANESQANDLVTKLTSVDYSVLNLEKKPAKKSAPTPFTTSSLQQAANRLLGFSAKQTMMLAQQLYEGVELGSAGHIGLITYMRTDSLNLSEKFLGDAKDYLTTTLGDKYCLAEPRRFKTRSKGAQEAHEAIRPTEANRQPDEIKDYLNNNQYRLYRLIWQRSLATQMPDAVLDHTVITVAADDCQFKAEGQILTFDGYLKIYPEASKDVELPTVTINEPLKLNELKPEQHFTKPPARYSDAGLVKELEKHGIGRPSTYAPTISTIEDRNYVERDENKKLKPTAIAFIVIDLLVEHFPEIVDLEFTARIEKSFDKIASGKLGWRPVIKNFYTPFHENLEIKYKEVDKKDVVPEETSTEICDKCGSAMIIKTGRFGKFLACSNFPECHNIKSLDKKADGATSADLDNLKEKYKDEKCSKCGAEMVVKTGRYGPFLACSAYPKCKTVKNIDVQDGPQITCPVCELGQIVKKRSRRGIFYACNRYPECKTAYWAKPTGEKCPECESLLIEDNKKGEIRCSNKTCNFKK